MKKTITYNQQDHVIDIEKSAADISVTFNGATFTFTKRPTHDGWILQHDSRAYKTSIVQKLADHYHVNVSGSPIEIIHQDPYALSGSITGVGAQGDIKAVMPGRVVKILVEEGQDVVQGQPVLVLEAMKMENEIKAPVDGKIEKIFVAQSTSVESGVMLVSIQPTT